ncbi:hypothetical protein KA107_00950 [Candidatus Pacearchaeota archaeon]|nr:hypothetical protein [Candidatus Pacearchaeota archaeon]
MVAKEMRRGLVGDPHHDRRGKSPSSLRLTQDELAQALDDVFRAGVPAVSFLRLTQEEARRYEGLIDNMNKYVAEVRGPSLDHDPLKQVPFYAVFVRKPTGGSL